MVCLFREKPSARPHSCRNPVKGYVSLGEVKEQSARMHEIEGCFFKRVANDVVFANLKIRKIEGFQESRVNVSRDHAPVWPALPTQPLHHRTTSSSDVQAPPALSDA